MLEFNQSNQCMAQNGTVARRHKAGSSSTRVPLIQEFIMSGSSVFPIIITPSPSYKLLRRRSKVQSLLRAKQTQIWPADSQSKPRRHVITNSHCLIDTCNSILLLLSKYPKVLSSAPPAPPLWSRLIPFIPTKPFHSTYSRRLPLASTRNHIYRPYFYKPTIPPLLCFCITHNSTTITQYRRIISHSIHLATSILETPTACHSPRLSLFRNDPSNLRTFRCLRLNNLRIRLFASISQRRHGEVEHNRPRISCWWRGARFWAVGGATKDIQALAI